MVKKLYINYMDIHSENSDSHYFYDLFGIGYDSIMTKEFKPDWCRYPDDETWDHELTDREVEICQKIKNHEIRSFKKLFESCLLYTSPSPRDATLSRMPSSA